MSLQSEQINELMSALAKAQGQMSHASKDSTNPFHKSKYADLASVWAACREPLASNGLALTQTLDFAGERQVMVTTLAHSSGQWIKSVICLPTLAKPQEVGSALTYYRRYMLAAMVGVYQDDDDAETASKPYRPEEKIFRITREQHEELEDFISEFPETRASLMKKFNVQEISQIPAVYFSGIVKTFKEKQKAKLDEN